MSHVVLKSTEPFWLHDIIVIGSKSVLLLLSQLNYRLCSFSSRMQVFELDQ